MGNLATPEFLIARWGELCRDPSLDDLPYKIELNAWGKIEMSPASNRHGRLQMAIGAEFMRQLPNGVAISECSVLTRIGIRVPDVVWASADFMAAYRGNHPLHARAGDLRGNHFCLERAGRDRREKAARISAAGAVEVWLVVGERHHSLLRLLR